MNLSCWKCGMAIADLPEPLGRREECPACHADLHVCRQCEFHDPRAPDECREPVADPVRDKDRANFCGYFTVKPDAHQAADNSEAAAAKRRLEALFGDQPDESSGGDAGLSEADAARKALDDLFGGGDGKP